MPKRKKKSVTSTKRPVATSYGGKSKFILSYPETTPSAEIVAAGAVKGLTFNAGYVSTIRSLARKRKAKGATAPAKAVGREKASAAPTKRGGRRPAAGAEVDESLVQTILRYGVVKVEEVLARVKAFRG